MLFLLLFTRHWCCKIRNWKINKLYSCSLRVFFFQESTRSKVKAVESHHPSMTYEEGQQRAGMENGNRRSLFRPEVHSCQGSRSGVCVCFRVGLCTGHRSKVMQLVSDPSPLGKTFTFRSLKQHLGL